MFLSGLRMFRFGVRVLICFLDFSSIKNHGVCGHARFLVEGVIG